MTAELIRAQRGGTLPSGWFETPGQILTKANVDAVITRQKSPSAGYDYYKDQITQLLASVKANMKPLSQAR